MDEVNFGFEIVWHLNKMKVGENYILPVSNKITLLITREEDCFGIVQFEAIREGDMSIGYTPKPYDDVCYNILQVCGYIEDLRNE